MNFDALKAAFDPDRVSWRVGSTNLDKDKKPPQGKSAAGIALAYIDSRDVQERLDAVCGPENWQDKYHVFGTTMICEIGIRIGDAWVWKSDGAGSTDIEAEKGQISDSFKRAAVKWGVGRYLYEIDSPWVEIEPMGRSFRIKADQKAKLRATLVRGAPVLSSDEKEPARAVSSPVQAQTLPPGTQTSPKMTPAQWGQDFLDGIRNTKFTSDALEAHITKNSAALVKLRAAEPVLHKDIMALIQLKQAAF